MSKITALRAAIRNDLLTICDNVYYLKAEDSTSYPYLIFSIQEVMRSDYMTACELEINAVSSGKSTSALEELVDAVDKIFDHRFFENSAIAYESYFNLKNNVASDDSNINRRRIVFDLKLYDKENLI